MKKLFIFVGMAVIGMFMSGCNDNPQKAVSEFAKALKKGIFKRHKMQTLPLKQPIPFLVTKRTLREENLTKHFLPPKYF